ncbi:hypothetical protein N431DRAFT_451620 [Stipitochalara longipes BDJ]|nr:hypothetical protein N431DRAFT_451620 [Stipitochalara longipes BDJ]
MLSKGGLNCSGCIWYSTSAVAQAFQASHFARFYNVSIIETTYKRTVGAVNIGVDIWAISTNAAVGLLSDQLAGIWQQAAWYATIKRQITRSYHNLDYRIEEATTARVQTKLPVVRVCCNFFDNSTHDKTTLGFPVLPEYERSGGDQFIVPATIVNSSSILTQWLPMLAGDTTTKNGIQTSDYPSAFMAIQIPHYNSTTEFAVLACSVDARWALGNNIATNIQNLAFASDSLQHGEVLHSQPKTIGNPFLPVRDGTWSKISIDLDWLYTLTPLLNYSSEAANAREAPGWTSYASLLSYIGMGNDTSLVTSWGDTTLTLKTSLAILVADALARIGFSANGGSMRLKSDASSILNISRTSTGAFTSEALDSMLKDDGNLVHPPEGIDPEDLTKLHWSITISGYAYKADSISYYLAIAVLLTHVFLVLCHIIYSFISCQSSDAWSSFEDLIVLSHSSPPDPLALKNTSAGLKCHSMIQRKLLFDEVPEVECKTVVPGQEYGAVD